MAYIGDAVARKIMHPSTCPCPLLKRLDGAAKSAGTSRAELIRSALTAHCDRAEELAEHRRRLGEREGAGR